MLDVICMKNVYIFLIRRLGKYILRKNEEYFVL